MSTSSNDRRRGSQSVRYTHDHQFGSFEERDLEPFPTPCPSWCTVADGTSKVPYHRDYEPLMGKPQTRDHTAPDFGAIDVHGSESLSSPGEVAIRWAVKMTRYPRDVAGLRALAADALAAADWIEAQA